MLSSKAVQEQERVNPPGSFSSLRGKSILGEHFQNEIMQRGERTACVGSCRNNTLCKGIDGPASCRN